MKTGAVSLPLHHGRAPKWLFKRMIKLCTQISKAVINEYGTKTFLERLSNPYWFQALGCTVGFDWHSSGLTTTTCAALKLGLKDSRIIICGGKGGTSRKTPSQISVGCEKLGLSTKKEEYMINSSKLCAKVDNNCIQDGYQLYHHCFVFNKKGEWTIIQQGMNNSMARRYHWFSENTQKFTLNPDNKICCDKKRTRVLNMTSKICEEAQKTCVDLINDNPFHLLKYFKRKGQTSLASFNMPSHHPVLDMDISKRGYEVLKHAYELQPRNYEELVALKGIGPKKIRALALVSDLVYGNELSWKDPVKYSFAHGGKDGHPYPVNKEAYDNTINTLKQVLSNSIIDRRNKKKALKRLSEFINT